MKKSSEDLLNKFKSESEKIRVSADDKFNKLHKRNKILNEESNARILDHMNNTNDNIICKIKK